MLKIYTHYLENLINSKVYFGFPCCPFLKNEFRTTVFFFTHLVVTFFSPKKITKALVWKSRIEAYLLSSLLAPGGTLGHTPD